MDKIDSKVILLAIHQGDVAACHDQKDDLKELQAEYGNRGLTIFQVFSRDDNGSSAKADLFEYTFGYKQYYDIDYQVLIDPAGVLSSYHQSTPTTLLLNDSKVIRFKQEGERPDLKRLKIYIERLLQ